MPNVLVTGGAGFITSRPRADGTSYKSQIKFVQDRPGYERSTGAAHSQRRGFLS
jgi:dTDP-D-glucose 4,6-dehydratase